MTALNTYKEITKIAFQKTVIQEQAPSILVFGAEWSGNAEIMNSMMNRVSKEFNNNTHFFKVDIDKYPEIATFFNIKTIPTIIMLKKGEVLDLIRGFTSANKIRKKIKTNY